MPADSAFAFSGVQKRFGDTVALRQIELEIARGRTTVLIGPSGCGKSTLLRLMVGLVVPNEGAVRFEEQLLAPDNVRALRLRMGYVIQDGGLFPHLTAAQNIELMAKQLGRSASDRRARIEALAEMTQFPLDALSRYPVELSGGQRQRVGLMRALMLDPDVLLMDEPLGALDPMIRAELQQQLREIFQNLGKTVVLVTHDLSEAGFFGDHIVLMRDGAIVQQGSFGALVREPTNEFVTAFVNAQRPVLDLSEGGQS